ncbi:cellulose synthase/poly-beta-1,6-N-acetylglucosamine synthase-like glycosyltransferase [Caldalkalibacillus uzonensis]|uniref:Cellulose synthase/poly-beta-1,6-N-acetylglucosamine synthase-like glycosyltransferase n=1 Tax=Caldalkalibacillus uzonensis TaxID=353224 RepID=A0ABU0CYA0_9BACI|nr:hypothetical protein [Caldalkalibacillus uzonensis]MDQ0341131.1 cellulose synthase/poly-beta-1,6-N-acetylglucosamine synthase-like glycosyltransferase [Caldalkalibacillus uzonensis]
MDGPAFYLGEAGESGHVSAFTPCHDIGRPGNHRSFKVIYDIDCDCPVRHLYQCSWSHTGIPHFFDYSPGVVTAILLIVPFSIMFFRQLIRQKEFSMKGIALFLVIGIVLMYPVILLFLFIAGLL